MAKEWCQYCKDCLAEYGYSDFTFQNLSKKGLSRPERCAKHRQQHAKEIRNLANSHFDIKPIQGPPSILGTPYIGEVSHGNRRLQEKDLTADPSSMDIGITEEDVKEVYKALDGNETLEPSQVLVIVGPTGSGKSTYLPFRLIEPLPPKPRDYYTRNGPIIVTQPRIQATRGVPDAVGKLLLGSSVGPGFEIGFRHGSAGGKGNGEQADAHNRLVFVTDGTLLNWISDGRIGEFSIVMIDEAHERSCNIDLILGLIRKELPRYPHLKLIVASATIDADKFVNYYSEVTRTTLLTFEGKKNHGYTIHWWKEASVDECSQTPKFMAEKILAIIRESKEGGILGFLPGQKEINEAVRLIRNGLGERQDVKVFPLYTALGVRMGDEALRQLPKVKMAGKWVEPRRVVIATNVAETSITIPDVVYVVDSGFIKMTKWNSKTCRQKLVPTRHSQDGCKQRWGRAGRVRKGEVYTLYTEEDFKGFPEHTPPEIVRSCLDNALLTSKAAGVTSIASFSWIDEPPAEEMKRSISVIQKRGLVDPDEDLTEEGFEVFRLSRSISRLLDKSDYNSTQRSLDVAALLIIADRYGCLLEAVTVLSMMPRMGSSLYWREDGLLVWDVQWDVASKDRVARIHTSLRTGCRDDLDFAFKLFSLYELNAPSDPGITVHSWCRRNLINAKNFLLVENAREGLLRAFTHGKKDLSLRPLDYLMIERLRVLMAIGWPDRVIKIQSGEPIRFIQADEQTEGFVSPHCCGNWTVGEKAIIGIMDSGDRQAVMANFLIREPLEKFSRDESEIAYAMAKLRKTYQQQAAWARLFPDLAYPVDSEVSLTSKPEGLSINGTLRNPRAFQVKRTSSFGIDEEQVESERFYERFSLESDDDSWEPELEDDTVDEIEIDEPEYQVAVQNLVNAGFSPPTYHAEWLSKPDSAVTEAVVVNWTIVDDSPMGVVAPAISEETHRETLAKLKIGNRIKAKLLRGVLDQHSGEFAGFIATGPSGIEIPLAPEDLGIPFKNPGLAQLEGRIVSLDIIQCDPQNQTLRVSRLKEVEEDLEKLLLLGEAKGTVSLIDKNAVYISIYRDGNFVHTGSIPIEVAARIISGLKIGMELFCSIEQKKIDDRPPYVKIGEQVQLSKNETNYFSKFGIRLIQDKLECSCQLSYKDVLSIASYNPDLYPLVRALYARTREVHLSNLETLETRQELNELLQEVRSIRDIVATADPAVTKSRLENVQDRAKRTRFSQRSWKLLTEAIQDAWAIRKANQALQFISRLQEQISDIENRIATSSNSNDIKKWQGWIRGNQEKISEVKLQIQGYESERSDIARQIQEIRNKIP